MTLDAALGEPIAWVAELRPYLRTLSFGNCASSAFLENELYKTGEVRMAIRWAQSLVLLLLSFVSISAMAADITVWKAARTLEYRDDEMQRQFRIALGTAPVGPKSRQGDRKTPEGVYFVTHKNPQSQFYLSLGISFPNLDDAKKGLRAGLISQREYDAIEAANVASRPSPQNTRLGGNIFIHGRGSASDWTWGCVALDDADMKFLYEHVRIGDKVTILE